MKSMWKRCLGLLLALMMVVSCVPVTVFAEDTECVHEYVDEVTPPGCGVGGYTTHSCSLCSYSYTDSETDPTGHSYAAVVTEPGCETGGYTTYTCSACGDSYTEDAVDALGHSYGDGVVTDPSCEKPGCTTYTCTVCGSSYSDSEVDALGHSYGEGVVTEPTCEDSGYTTYTCTVCGGSYTDSEVEALGHQYEEGVCTVCGGQEPGLLANEDAEAVTVAFLWKNPEAIPDTVSMTCNDSDMNPTIVDLVHVEGTAFFQGMLPVNTASVDFEVEADSSYRGTFAYPDGETPAENDLFIMESVPDENEEYGVELMRDFTVVANPEARLAEVSGGTQKTRDFATLKEALAAANASTAEVVDIYLQKSVTLEETITVARAMGIHGNPHVKVTATNNAYINVTSGWPMFECVILETTSDYGYKLTGRAGGCMLNNSPILGGANTVGIHSDISGGNIEIYMSEQGEDGYAYMIQGKTALEIEGENTRVVLAGQNAPNWLKGSNPAGVIVVGGDGNRVEYYGNRIENTTSGGKAFCLSGNSRINPGKVFQAGDGEPAVYDGTNDPMPNEGAVAMSTATGCYCSSLQSAFYDAEQATNLEHEPTIFLQKDILLTETAVLGKTQRPVVVQMNGYRITSADDVELDTLLKIKTDFTLDFGNPGNREPDHKVENPAEGGRCIDFGDVDDTRHYDLRVQGVPVLGGPGGYGIVSRGSGRIILAGSLVSSVDIQSDHMELQLQGATLTGMGDSYEDDFATIRIQASDVNVLATAAPWDPNQKASLNAGYSRNGEKRHIFSAGSEDQELREVRFWISEGTVLMGDVFDSAGNVDVKSSDLQFHKDQVVSGNDLNITDKLVEEGLAWEDVIDGDTGAPNGYIRIAPVALFKCISNPIYDENGQVTGANMDKRNVSYFTLHEAIEASLQEDGYNRVLELLADTTLNKTVEITKGVGIQGRQGATKLRLVDDAYFDVKGEVFQLFWMEELATYGEYAIKVSGEKSQVFLGGVHMTNSTTEYGIYVAEAAEGTAVMMNAGNDGELVTGVTVNGSKAGVKILADHVTVCMFNDDGEDAVKVEGNVALDIQADHADVQVWAANAEVNGMEMAIRLVGDNSKVQYGASGNTAWYGNNAEGIVQIAGDGNTVDVWSGNIWNIAEEGSPVFKLDGDSRFQFGTENDNVPNIGAKVKFGRCYFGGLQSAFDFVAEQNVPEEDRQPGNQFPLNVIGDIEITKPVVLEKADLDVMLYLNGHTIHQEQAQTGDYAMITVSEGVCLGIAGDHTFEGNVRGTISYSDTSEIYNTVSYASTAIRNLGTLVICHADVVNDSSAQVARYGNAYAVDANSAESDVKTEIGIGAKLINEKGYTIRQYCAAPDHSNTLNILNGELQGGIEMVSAGPDANQGQLKVGSTIYGMGDGKNVLYLHGVKNSDYANMHVQINGGYMGGHIEVDEKYEQPVIYGTYEVIQVNENGPVYDDEGNPVMISFENHARFSEEPESRLIEQGYEAAWDDAGSYYITRTEMAAFVDTNGDGLQGENEQTYKHVDDALAAAEDGQTVKLLKDTSADLIMVGAGKSLDLNGKMLWAEYVAAFGQIKDTAEDVGGIIVEKDKAMLQNNEQMPLYDVGNGCYRFFVYIVAAAKNVTVYKESQAVEFKYAMKFLNSSAYDILLDYGFEAGLRIGTDLRWTTLEENTKKEFTYSDTHLREYANKQLTYIESGQNKTATFVYRVSNLGIIAAQNLTCDLFVDSMGSMCKVTMNYLVPEYENN